MLIRSKFQLNLTVAFGEEDFSTFYSHFADLRHQVHTQHPPQQTLAVYITNCLAPRRTTYHSNSSPDELLQWTKPDELNIKLIGLCSFPATFLNVYIVLLPFSMSSLQKPACLTYCLGILRLVSRKKKKEQQTTIIKLVSKCCNATLTTSIS